MSARHTRTWATDVYMEGHALIPSMGFVGSIVPGGRHRKCDDCPFEDGRRCNTRLTECR